MPNRLRLSGRRSLPAGRSALVAGPFQPRVRRLRGESRAVHRRVRHLSMGAMLSEMFTAKDGYRDELAEPLLIMPRYEATLSSVLPNRKTGAGGSPCVHHFRIRPRSGSDPFEQIEYQGFYCIRQRGLSMWLVGIRFDYLTTRPLSGRREPLAAPTYWRHARRPAPTAG